MEIIWKIDKIRIENIFEITHLCIRHGVHKTNS
jgi:hypothetical protein